MKRQHSNGFINDSALPLPSNPCAIRGTKIQTFKDFVNGDFWRFFGDSRNDESSTAYSFRRSVYDCSVDFPWSRIAFAFAFAFAPSCHSEMQNAAVCNRGRCIRSHEERRFPHVAYVTTYIKALLLVRRKKERERILLRTRTTRQCTTHFSLPHRRYRTASVQINCTGSTWRDDEGAARTR